MELREQIKELDRTIEALVAANAPDKVVGSLELKRQKLIKALENENSTKKEEAADTNEQSKLELELEKIDEMLATTSKDMNHSTEKFMELIKQRFAIVDKLKGVKQAKPNPVIEENLKKLDERDEEFIKKMRLLGNRLNSTLSVKCPVCETKYWTLKNQCVQCCSSICEEEYELHIVRGAE